MLKSIKNSMKRAKQAVAALPRTMKVLEAEEADLRSKAGSAQYQIHVYTKHLAEINKRLESVNNEAAARMELDKQQVPEVKEEQAAT